MTGASTLARGSLKYDLLYREEIRDGAQFADEVDASPRLYDGRRPHQALAFLTPHAATSTVPGYDRFRADSVQHS